MELTQGMAAVVTGGASGLGKASAQALADLGLKVTIFDVNEEAGEAHAQAIGGTFARVDITDEQSVVDGFAAARAAHGQERVTVHCAMTSRRGKTLGWDKQNNCYKRLSTEDYAFGAEGILVSSYRVASLSALGMANAQPVNEDGERGCITLTASVAAQDGQIGLQVHGNGKTLVQVKDVTIETLPPTPNAPTWEKVGRPKGKKKTGGAKAGAGVKAKRK